MFSSSSSAVSTFEKILVCESSLRVLFPSIFNDAMQRYSANVFFFPTVCIFEYKGLLQLPDVITSYDIKYRTHSPNYSWDVTFRV